MSLTTGVLARDIDVNPPAAAVSGVFFDPNTSNTRANCTAENCAPPLVSCVLGLELGLELDPELEPELELLDLDFNGVE